MIVARPTFLPCRAEQCIEAVVTPRLLQYVSWPLVVFVPVAPPVLPQHWQEKEYSVGMRLFGLVSCFATPPRPMLLKLASLAGTIRRTAG